MNEQSRPSLSLYFLWNSFFHQPKKYFKRKLPNRLASDVQYVSENFSNTYFHLSTTILQTLKYEFLLFLSKIPFVNTLMKNTTIAACRPHIFLGIPTSRDRKTILFIPFSANFYKNDGNIPTNCLGFSIIRSLIYVLASKFNKFVKGIHFTISIFPYLNLSYSVLAVFRTTNICALLYTSLYICSLYLDSILPVQKFLGRAPKQSVEHPQSCRSKPLSSRIERKTACKSSCLLPSHLPPKKRTCWEYISVVEIELTERQATIKSYLI
ncbi:hypothetical protein TTHERM_000058959 (macronuclear) [Tetrahymena thermophila SB210]|uniref:Uncharacterized protein n=1 Tax=Tetrahymena thermophila (strain SB210) TaxID=312017 RepID=W7XKG0_TETTS|nr:hypothetical protein TTHERM_000058959 [Tetrahymena thermophila SB210]EWS76496.1 hypothetical protein TTHERM_000058959 [Tetrahymena thermophila SB210]|eukprot:XP_012650969.1 hypothetical protein TTHERM_000058959 [Tetrahymena thermophila SB210]